MYAVTLSYGFPHTHMANDKPHVRRYIMRKVKDARAWLGTMTDNLVNYDDARVFERSIHKIGRVVGAVWDHEPDYDGDSVSHRFSVSLNARTRKHYLTRSGRRELIAAMTHMDLVREPGCNCAHCQNDWDCCGRMAPSGAYVVPRKGGVYVIQNFNRNV